MKINKIFISSVIVVLVISLTIIRLITNKNNFKEELKLVSPSNMFIPVITDTVSLKYISPTFSAEGSFSAMHEISISAESPGSIISFSAEVGDRVIEGDLLATLEHESFASQLKAAKSKLDQAEKDFQRNKELLKTDGVTRQQYEYSEQAIVDSRAALQFATDQYNHCFIKAPFNGTITGRYVEKGMNLAPGMPVFDIADIDNVKLTVKLTADDFRKVHKYQKVRVRVKSGSNMTLEGTVITLSIKADESKRYNIEIKMNNTPDRLLKPGMYGIAEFPESAGVKALVIPRKALTGSIKKPVVFLIVNDSAVSRSITVTSLNEKEVCVQDGLNVGDVIVTSGQINLVNGTKIKVR
jgi:membrane fusion protein (multidrug efflux system)